jgi:murein DD-endopeptidase MepM/ murein hydrolase activator NlpD
MSSLHHDRLLVEGSEPVTGTGSTLGTARGTSRKPVAEKATHTAPTQRQGKSQRSGSTQTTTDAPRARRTVGGRVAAAATAGSITARAKAAGAATGKVASARAATARAATAKVASAKTATAKAATARAVTTAKAAAAAKAAKATAAQVPAAKPAAAKPAVATVAATKPAVAKPAAAKPAAAAKATVAKSSAAKPAAAKASAAKASAVTAPATATAAKPVATEPAAERTTGATTSAVRPTPFKRAAAVETPVAAEPAEVPTSAPAAEITADEQFPSDADAPRSRFGRRRPPSLGRRPGLYLAAALAGALSVSAFSTGDLAAQATSNVSHSVSIAEELGIDSASATEISAVDTERLGELAVSRNVRDAEQAAAAQVQARADQVAAAAAAEAARPKAVLPVSGARLTSGFGARWGTVHAGIDLAAPMQTPEYAAMDGIVLKAGAASGYGLVVYIQHENGDVTVYGHMDSILVDEGQVVRAGETIALLGNRGQSTGPHLHFEVHVGGMNGTKIDPLPWLRERGVKI